MTLLHSAVPWLLVTLLSPQGWAEMEQAGRLDCFPSSLMSSAILGCPGNQYHQPSALQRMSRYFTSVSLYHTTSEPTNQDFLSIWNGQHCKQNQSQVEPFLQIHFFLSWERYVIPPQKHARPFSLPSLLQQITQDLPATSETPPPLYSGLRRSCYYSQISPYREEKQFMKIIPQTQPQDQPPFLADCQSVQTYTYAFCFFVLSLPGVPFFCCCPHLQPRPFLVMSNHTNRFPSHQLCPELPHIYVLINHIYGFEKLTGLLSLSQMRKQKMYMYRQAAKQLKIAVHALETFSTLLAQFSHSVSQYRSLDNLPLPLCLPASSQPPHLPSAWPRASQVNA